MRNTDTWQQTKFELRWDGLVGSRDTRELSATSRCTADAAARAYERMIRQHARGILLDLGAGKAPLYGVYRDHVSGVICVDWPSGPHGSKHLDFAADLNQGLGLRDASVDTVLSTSVLEHIADPHVFWREAHRVLRPGGKILVATPFLYGIHEAPHDYCRYTQYWYRRMCAAHGFREVSISPYGGGVDVALHVIGKTLDKARPAYGRLFAALLPAFQRLGSRLNEASATILPSGYAVVAERL